MKPKYVRRKIRKQPIAVHAALSLPLGEPLLKGLLALADRLEEEAEEAGMSTVAGQMLEHAVLNGHQLRISIYYEEKACCQRRAEHAREDNSQRPRRKAA